MNMAYNKRYYYKQIIKVLDIVEEKEALGIPYTVIYKDYIETRFNISFSTFSNYLTITDAQEKLAELENQTKNNPKK